MKSKGHMRALATWVAAVVALAGASPPAVPVAGCDAPVGQRASCYAQRWTMPPRRVPSGSSTDGPLVGNGDLGVVAGGGTGRVQLYTGKNDFWLTKDAPTGGCAYGVSGTGSLAITETSSREQSTPTSALNCSLFNCSCQGFADYYGAVAGEGWGCCPQPEGKDWWSTHHCTARTHGSYCDGPACKLPHAATCPPHKPVPPPPTTPGVWNATQDLQGARISVDTITAGGTRIQTSTIVAATENTMLTTLSVSRDATLTFDLAIRSSHAVQAGVTNHGMPWLSGETAFRDRNFASVLPCSASDIISPAIRTVTVGGNNALNAHNGTSVGCFVLQTGGADVVHEPEASICMALGDAARWKPVPTAASGAAAVQLQSVQNTSACLHYGNGTPTDFGARKVFVGPCSGAHAASRNIIDGNGGSSGVGGSRWIVDAAGSTVAASNENLFEQPGQRQCLSAAPPNYNNSIVQSLTIVVAATGQAVPLFAIQLSNSAGSASVQWQANLSAGTDYMLTLSSLSRRDVGDTDPTDASHKLAFAAARNSTALHHAHTEAWKAYWLNCASVSLGKRSLLEGFWFGSQYLFGSATALGKVPPGLWGPWVTATESAWNGDYTLDYNFQANYWGAASSNMPEMITPFVDTMLRLLPLGRERAAAPDWSVGQGFFGATGQHVQGMQCGHSKTNWAGPLGQCPASADLGGYSGLNFPGHMGPWSGQEFPTDMGIRSVAAFAWTPLMQMYDTTQDRVLLQDKVYPYLRGIVDFYLNPNPAGKSYLVTGSDGKLHVPYSCGDEICHDELGAGYGVDPMEDMGFVRMALAKAVAYSAVLGVDASLRPKWSAALAAMAPFRTTEVNGLTVFAQSASFATDWNKTNETSGWPGTGIVYTGYPIIYDSGIHPADVITRSSEPQLLQVARNTVWTDGELVEWNPVNGFVLSWIPAARIVERANASKLLDGFEAAINSSVYLNWYHPHGGGGFEDVGSVEAVNCMLLLSIEGFLRFFPAWPLGEQASFRGLRASGAFIVSGSIDASGTVGGVSLVSEAGGKCTFLNPWATVPSVWCGGAAVHVDALAGGKFSFATMVGQSCAIEASA